MINLRYHIVSLVAVFLALAVGIVMGTTVISHSTLDLLRLTTTRVDQANDAYRHENENLRAQVGNWQRFGTYVLPAAVAGRLRGRHFVLVGTDQVAGSTQASVVTALTDAGALVDGQISFKSSSLALSSSGDRSQLAAILGEPTMSPDALRSALSNQLARRLVSPSQLPASGTPQGTDLLTALAAAGFINSMATPPAFSTGVASFPPTGTAFVLLGPSSALPLLSPQQFLLPLAAGLVSHHAVVAGVESSTDPPSLAVAIRADSAIVARVMTVDDVDLVFGQVALDDALQQRFVDGIVGHYGQKQGAQGVLPTPAGS